MVGGTRTALADPALMLAPLKGPGSFTASACLSPDLSMHPSLLLFPRPGDPVDAPAAVPGAGTGFSLDSGIGPCLPPGCPVGSCQCCPGLRLFKTALLPLHPWSTDQEWQVKAEWGSHLLLWGSSPGSTSHAVSVSSTTGIR